MGTALMARRNRQNTKGAAIAQTIMEEYQPQTREEMQDAIRDIFGPMFEAMLQGEMDSHLGYGNNESGEKTPRTGAMDIPISPLTLRMGKWMFPCPGTGKGALNRKRSPNVQRMSAGLKTKYCPCMRGV